MIWNNLLLSFQWFHLDSLSDFQEREARGFQNDLDQGWPDFFARGAKFKTCKVLRAAKNSPNNFWLCFPYKMMPINMVVHHNSLLQELQKIFGGPHAARGPQFGHVWDRSFTTTVSGIWISLISCVNWFGVDSSQFLQIKHS